VDAVRVKEPQIIYGTPKLEYPYKDFDNNEYKDFSSLNGRCTSFLLANKWNGYEVVMSTITL
jgi:hypothetical protein